MRRNTAAVNRRAAIVLVWIRDGLELHLGRVHVIDHSAKKVNIIAHVGGHCGTAHHIVWQRRRWPVSRRARQVRAAFVVHASDAQNEVTRLL